MPRRPFLLALAPRGAQHLEFIPHLCGPLECLGRQGFEQHGTQRKNVGACVGLSAVLDLGRQHAFFVAERSKGKIR